MRGEGVLGGTYLTAQSLATDHIALLVSDESIGGQEVITARVFALHYAGDDQHRPVLRRREVDYGPKFCAIEGDGYAVLHQPSLALRRGFNSRHIARGRECD